MILLLPAFFPTELRGQKSADNRIVDSLEAVLPGLSPGDTARASIYQRLCKAYMYTDPRKAIDYGKKAESFRESHGMRQVPALYIILGRAWGRLPDAKNALLYFRKALSVAQDQKDINQTITAYIALGWHHYRFQEISISILNFEMAMETAQMIHDTKGEAEACYGLALVYYIAEDTENQYRYMNRFLELADPVRDARMVSDALRFIGEYYRMKREYASAIANFEKAFNIAMAAGDSAMMGVAVNHLAWTYYEKGDLDKSLEVYEKNMEFTLPSGKAQTEANIYGNIGNIYRDWERYPEALEYYKKSLDISRESGDIFNQAWLYKDISLLYSRMGEYRKAYENALLHSTFNDSLMSSTYRRKIMTAQAEYEADRKAKELELLKLQLDKNRYLIYVLVGSMGLLIAIAVIILLTIRSRSKLRLQEMDRRILEMKQANLRQQMNPHFIFNTLNAIQYYVFQNDRIASNNYMTKFASLIRKTLENSRHTAINIKEELEALGLYLELEALRFKEKFEWKITVDEEIDTLSYKIPTMLIQPYVENAITHGLMHKEGKGTISIDLELKDQFILCTIEDNGIGRQRSREINLEKNHYHNSLGTTITESRLRLVNELYGSRMAVNFTDLADQAGEPSGTRVEVTIPIIT
jgi:tetratricopeptide (TPR) repeat protein